MLFECLTGEVPFPRDSEVAAIYAHLEDEPPQASQRRPGLPPALDDVISRALEKEPGDRWQSGAEFVGAARAALPGGVVRRPARLPRRVPRRALVVFALMAVLAILGGLLLARSGKDPTIALADADAVAVIDPGRASLLDDIDVGASPSDVAAGAGAVWVANADGGSVSRIDRRTRTPRQTIPVGAGPIAVAVGAGGVWTANSLDGTVSWISPATNLEVERIPVGNGPTGVCVAGGVVWIAVSDDHAILRFDPVSRRRKTTPLEDVPTQLACGGGFVWASSESAGTVTQISVADGGVVHRIPAGGGASGLAWGAGALWVANTREGTVSRIDPRRGAPTAAIPVGARAGPVHLAVGADGVWVSNEAEGTLARIDPARQAVVDTPLRVGNRPQGLAVVDGSLWVAVRASGAQHRGGTLRILESKGEVFLPGGRLDPAAIFTPEAGHILGLINDGLVTFRRVGGRQGATLVADLAVSLPTPTDRGRTYAFQLRHGIKYSTGEPVRASDFRRQLERVVRKGVAPEGFYGGIRGAKACAARHADCDLSPGIRVDDAAGTITFRLTAADPDFLYKLAQTLAVPVPPGTSVSALRKPLPATGPYQVAKLDRKHLRLVRNPRFLPTDGRPAGYADEINFAFDVDRREAIRAVQRGRADLVGTVALSGAPRAQLDAIVTRYAGQLHADVQPLTNFMFLNTRVPPFNRLDARRALNFAVDRRAAVAVHGGDRFAQVTCQILPPNFPGYRPYCPYTTGAGGGGPWAAPDLAQARRLVARSHTRGMAVTVLGIRAGYFAGHARLMRKVLDELGYKATLRLLPADKYFAYAPPTGARSATSFSPPTTRRPPTSSKWCSAAGPVGCFRDSAIRPATGSWSARSGCRPRIARRTPRGRGRSGGSSTRLRWSRSRTASRSPSFRVGSAATSTASRRASSTTGSGCAEAERPHPSDQVKRVSARGGARPPGRSPRRTSRTGVAARRASSRRAVPSPPGPSGPRARRSRARPRRPLRRSRPSRARRARARPRRQARAVTRATRCRAAGSRHGGRCSVPRGCPRVAAGRRWRWRSRRPAPPPPSRAGGHRTGPAPARRRCDTALRPGDERDVADRVGQHARDEAVR